MTSYKRLFQRAVAAAPERLHFTAHSHHLWPDASYVGQLAYWEDSARFADNKWDRVLGEIFPAGQHHVAAELNLPDASTVVFAPNTHELLVRLFSAFPRRPVRVLSTEGEFHSFRRQSARWAEAGTIALERVPIGADFSERLLERARSGEHDLIFVSQLMYGSGAAFERIEELAALAGPEGPWVVIDGYHGFMAVETDLSRIADRVFYLSGGYKYAMAGEGVGLMHAPSGYGPRPEVTGWFAEFDDLTLPPGSCGYLPDARRFMGATFDPTGLYRFVAVRDMLAQEGLTTAKINAHVAGLRARFLAGIGATPLAAATLLNPPGNGPQARFLAFQDSRAQAWKKWLDAEDVSTDVRADVLRIGFGLYQDPIDVDRLLEVLVDLPR